MTDRKFGIEIEAYGVYACALRNALRNAGIEAEVEHYNHHTREHWKITTDSSINPPDNSPTFELVSPPLRGEAGYREVATVCAVLESLGASVNRSCGLHVHIDASGLDAPTLFHIAERYRQHENVIDAFMPRSRRGDNNSYCHSVGPLSRYDVARFDRIPGFGCRNIVQYYPMRMAKVNLQAYIAHGTVEFRHHSGTTNATKITNWVKFCQNFVETSRQQVAAIVTRSTTNRTATPSRRGRSVQRENIMLDMMEARASVNTLSAATGLAPASIPVMISNLRRRGAVIVKRRGYYTCSRRPSASVEATSSVWTRVSASTMVDPFQNLTPELRSYFHERTMELAS